MAGRRRLTIDDLAQDTGASSRSIRYYQTRGLLPAPTVKGRTGYYDQRHVDRLALISELQTEGLNLQAIVWLLGGSGAVDSDELRQLKRAVLDGWIADEPMEIEVKTVLREFDIADDPAALDRAVELGFVERTEDPARVRLLLPAVFAAGRELGGMAIGYDRLLDLLALIREHASVVADAYVDVFDEAVLAPWDARGRPAGEWPDVRERVDRMRPLAGEALLAVFGQVMTQAIADRLGGEDQPDAPSDESGGTYSR